VAIGFGVMPSANVVATRQLKAFILAGVAYDGMEHRKKISIELDTSVEQSSVVEVYTLAVSSKACV